MPTFTYNFGSGDDLTITTNGLTTDLDSGTAHGPGYDITGISGTFFGHNITGEAGAGGYEGFVAAEGTQIDNIIFDGDADGVDGSAKGIDVEGLGFTIDLGGGTVGYVNVSYNFGAPGNGSPLYSAQTTINGVDSNASLNASFNSVTTSPNVPCYCRGSLILTERGEVAVERLQVGDRVVTASGYSRPVVWLGHRTLDISRHPAPLEVWPVRVAAGAFGENLPRRDLWLSPGHNIAAEGVIMPICALVNGHSVARVKQDKIEYWHVELDAHDIILAEGLPAESYLDCGNRTAFLNGGAFVEAHPSFQPKHWAETCLPLVQDGPEVAATKARLIGLLQAQGFALTRDACAHIVADGQRLEPVQASEAQLVFVAPDGAETITLHSNVFIPAQTVADSADRRELGLCIEGLEIDGATVALDSEELMGTGWHQGEYEGGAVARRWTSGNACLPAGARNVIVRLAGQGYYWRAPVESDVAGLPETPTVFSQLST